MALPAWTVQAAFTTDPLDPSPVWEDLSDRLISFQSDRGKGDELQDFDAGTATFVFNNEDGELTPANTSGTWFGMLLPNRLIRAKATWNAVDYWQFTGLIEAYEQIVSPGSPQLCSLRCVDGIKILNLERTPEYPDYPEEVERVLDPVWGSWRMNEPPATRVVPGGRVRRKKPKLHGGQKWRRRRSRTQRFLASASGPEAQVIGNPAFLQSVDDGPASGEFTYGMSFIGGTAAGSNEKIRIPVQEAEDRPGAENAITVSCIIYPRSTSGVLVRGPEQGAGLVSWTLNLTGGQANLQVVCTDGVLRTVSGGSITADSWWHIVATWRGDTGVGQVFVNGVREAREDGNAGGGTGAGTMERGDTGSPIYVANSPDLSGATAIFNGIMADLVISEHKFPDEADNSAIQNLYKASIAGFGSPANLPLSGERIEAVLDGNAAADFAASYYTSARRDIDPGEIQVLPQRLDETKLDLLRRAEEAENGMLFIDKQGILTFHDNAWLTGGGGATVFATLASDGVGIDFQGIAPASSDDMLYPVVTVLREDGNTQVAGDETQFFGQPLELTDTLHIADADAANLASILASRYGTARSRIYSLELDAMSDDLLYPIVLGAEIGNRVSVEHTYPDGTVETFDCRIIGIGRNSEGHLNTARWALCPSYVPDDGYWHLGVTGLSELGTSTKLA